MLFTLCKLNLIKQERLNSFRLVVLKIILVNGPVILYYGLVSDLPLEFCDNKLLYYHKRMEMRFSSKGELFLADETKSLLQKGVIKESQHGQGEFISQIFLVPKHENFFRMILNRKFI